MSKLFSGQLIRSLLVNQLAEWRRHVIAAINSPTDWYIVWRVTSRQRVAGRHWKEVDVYWIQPLLVPESCRMLRDFQVKAAERCPYQSYFSQNWNHSFFAPAGAVQLHQEPEAAMDTVSLPTLTCSPFIPLHCLYWDCAALTGGAQTWIINLSLLKTP